ncbi:MAG TPA: TetR/AcrR family transcriptional regulator [Pseudonocardia sp.]|nr:TetR/AcrR family transcriptional regulator [Pseudonocardia sp.]
MRRAILVAAGEQFAAKGFAGASLGGIAERCGLTKGSLYFHFKTKQALADAVVAAMLDSWQRLRARVAESRLDPLRALVAETGQVLGAIAVDPLMRGGFRLATDPDAAATAGLGHVDFGEDAVVQRLALARDAGLLRPGVEPEVVARQVVALFVGHLTIAGSPSARPAHAAARMDEAWSLLLPAVAADPWLAEWGVEHVCPAP